MSPLTVGPPAIPRRMSTSARWNERTPLAYSRDVLRPREIVDAPHTVPRPRWRRAVDPAPRPPGRAPPTGRPSDSTAATRSGRPRSRRREARPRAREPAPGRARPRRGRGPAPGRPHSHRLLDVGQTDGSAPAARSTTACRARSRSGRATRRSCARAPPRPLRRSGGSRSSAIFTTSAVSVSPDTRPHSTTAHRDRISRSKRVPRDRGSKLTSARHACWTGRSRYPRSFVRCDGVSASNS